MRGKRKCSLKPCQDSAVRPACSLEGRVFWQDLLSLTLYAERILNPSAHLQLPSTTGWLLARVLTWTLGTCVTDLSVKDSQPGRAKLSRTELLQRTAFSRVFFLLPWMCLAPWSVMNRGTGLTGHAVGRLPQDPLSPASTDCTPSGAILSALASEPPGTLQTVRQLSPPPGLGAHEYSAFSPQLY